MSLKERKTEKMTELTRPVLHYGARVALICPSSPIGEGQLEKSVKAMERMGFEPVVYESASARRAYLAGSDELRAADINRAFGDRSIDGIWCARGGYGGHRILPLLDFDVIRANPKFFGGYSDITAFLTAFTQNCGFAAYHCIMPSSDMLGEGADEYSMASLEARMFGKKTDYANPAGRERGKLNGGVAEGRLTGGNLSLLVASLGTPWEIDTKGRLLFIEEVHERPYRVDGFLTSLRNAGKFDDCAGILLGQFTDCNPNEGEDSLTLDEVFDDLIKPCGKPVITNIVCGHCAPSMSLPMGVEFQMDADKGVFFEK